MSELLELLLNIQPPPDKPDHAVIRAEPAPLVTWADPYVRPTRPRAVEASCGEARVLPATEAIELREVKFAQPDAWQGHSKHNEHSRTTRAPGEDQLSC